MHPRSRRASGRTEPREAGRGGTGSLWLVDAYNVLRVSLAPDTDEPWWSARRRDLLRARACRLQQPALGPEAAPGDSRVEVCLVFDARQLSATEESEVARESGPEPLTDPAERPPDDSPQPLVRVLFTPSADEWIVAAARSRRSEFDRILVVTADRRLANRARSRDAEVVDTGRFLELCAPEP